MVQREIGSFSEDQTRIIWDVVRKALAASGINNTRKVKIADEPSPHRVFFRNDSGEEIPPFGCMEVTGTDDEMDRTFVTVKKPESICGEYLFNSQFAVAADGFGWGYAFGLVRMRGTASAYESCKRYTAEVDSWDVAEGPGPFLVYGADSVIEGALRGRIVGDHCKARWIQFTYTTGGDNTTVTPTAFFDGPDPSECGDVTVSYPLGEPLCDTPLLAFYDPNTDEYQAVSTPSALMGEPVTQTLVNSIEGEDCGIAYNATQYRTFPNSCDPEPTPTSVALGADIPVIVAASSDECGKINYSWQSIRAFLCDSEGEPTEPSQTSFNINFGTQKFVTAASFGANSCGGNATYTWNTTTDDWDLTEPCPSGCESTPPPIPDPLPTTEITEEVSCTSRDDAQCGLNLQLLSIGDSCDVGSSGGPTPETVHVPLILEPVTVVTEVYDNATDAIVVERAVIYVCNFEAAPDDQIPVDPCEDPGSGGP